MRAKVRACSAWARMHFVYPDRVARHSVDVLAGAALNERCPETIRASSEGGGKGSRPGRHVHHQAERPTDSPSCRWAGGRAARILVAVPPLETPGGASSPASRAGTRGPHQRLALVRKQGRELGGACVHDQGTRPAPAAGRSPPPRGGHFTGPTLRHFVYSRAGPARESPILPSLRSVQELGTRLKTTRRWRRPLPTTRGRRPRGLTRFKRAGGHGRCGRALRLLNHREGERGVAGRRTERSIRDEPAGSGLLRLANAERAVGLYVFDPPSASRASRG